MKQHPIHVTYESYEYKIMTCILGGGGGGGLCLILQTHSDVLVLQLFLKWLNQQSSLKRCMHKLMGIVTVAITVLVNFLEVIRHATSLISQA